MASSGCWLGGVLRTGEPEEVSSSELPILPLGPQTLLLGHSEHNYIELFFNAQNLIRTNFSLLFVVLSRIMASQGQKKFHIVRVFITKIACFVRQILLLSQGWA